MMSKATSKSAAKPEAEALDIEAAPKPNPSLEKAEKLDKAEKLVAAAKPASAARVKKAKSAGAKGGSIMPDEQKLEQLREAVSTAGDADTLLKILDHVDQAGGPAEVIQNIETYRALRTAVEGQSV